MIIGLIISITIAIFLGILAGTLTGLTPGIHINLIAILLLSISTTLLKITTPLILTIFIVSMAITHTFIDYIPSIFFGAPDEDSFLSVLPGHQLLLKGRGYYAIVLTLYGSLSALFTILLLTPIFIFILPIIYPYVLRIMPLILILTSGYLIISEHNPKSLNPNPKLWALIIFLLAGFLGIASSNLNIEQPLLPLLTGLFGASNLLISINQKTKIPLQKITKLKNIRLKKSSIAKASFASIISAPLTAFLPGLGAAQSALIGKQVTNIQDQREFLFLLGAINTIVMALSFIALYSIQKTRTGAAVTISKLLPTLSTSNLLLILLTILITGFLSFILTITLAKFFAKTITKISYTTLSITIISILFIIITLFSDPTPEGRFRALLLFLTSTSLGIFTISKQIKRMHLMGCLLVPTILYYLW
jgi:putative membrane protein